MNSTGWKGDVRVLVVYPDTVMQVDLPREDATLLAAAASGAHEVEVRQVQGRTWRAHYPAQGAGLGLPVNIAAMTLLQALGSTQVDVPHGTVVFASESEEGTLDTVPVSVVSIARSLGMEVMN